MLTMLAGLALAAPPGFSSSGERDGCALFLGKTQEDGTIGMRSECHWPDVFPETLGRIFDNPGQHDQVWERVVAARVLARDGGWQRVWQQHHVGIVADREAIVDWTRSLDETTWRWSWVDIGAEGLPLVEGNVPLPRWDGFWQVSPDGTGGVILVHENHYSPAGFPAWLVRPFLAGQLNDCMQSLHEAAR